MRARAGVVAEPTGGDEEDEASEDGVMMWGLGDSGEEEERAGGDSGMEQQGQATVPQQPLPTGGRMVFETMSFREPHKMFQNSFSIFQKRGDGYGEPVLTSYP